MDDNGAFDQMGSEWNKILEELGYARDVSRSYASESRCLSCTGILDAH